MCHAPAVRPGPAEGLTTLAIMVIVFIKAQPPGVSPGPPTQRRNPDMVVRTAVAVAALVSASLLAACSSASGAPTAPGGGIVAVGAENEYANVISQIGGKYVHVTAILSNPNTDPHTFESSPSISQTVSAA